MQTNSALTIVDVLNFCQMYRQLNTFVHKEDSVQSNSNNSFETAYVKQKSFTKRQATTKDNQQIKTFEGNCQKCGTKHTIRECPAFGKTCLSCGKMNHFKRCCKSSGQLNANRAVKCKRSENNVDIFTLNKNSSDAKITTVFVNNKRLDFQLDTGAAISIMSKKQWELIGSPTLKDTLIIPTNFDGSKIATLGEIELNIIVNGKNLTSRFIIVQSDKKYGLISSIILSCIFLLLLLFCQ